MRAVVIGEGDVDLFELEPALADGVAKARGLGVGIGGGVEAHHEDGEGVFGRKVHGVDRGDVGDGGVGLGEFPEFGEELFIHAFADEDLGACAIPASSAPRRCCSTIWSTARANTWWSISTPE